MPRPLLINVLVSEKTKEKKPSLLIERSLFQCYKCFLTLRNYNITMIKDFSFLSAPLISNLFFTHKIPP